MLVPSCPTMRRARPTPSPPPSTSSPPPPPPPLLLLLLVLGLLAHLADAQSKWTVPSHKHAGTPGDTGPQNPWKLQISITC